MIDPGFCLVWFRFRLFRRYLALWPSQVGRAYRLLEMVSEGSPGHGPIHLLSACAAETGFRWDPPALAWTRLGLTLLSNLEGPVQLFKADILMLGVTRLQLIFVVGRVFGVALCWMCIHVRERDKALLRSVMVGGVWNGFLLGRVRGQPVPCRFCRAPDGDGHFLGVHLSASC